MRPYLLLFVVLLTSLHVTSQDVLINKILSDLQQVQIQKDSFYYKGMFASYRSSAKRPQYAVDDNNIFFTALIAFTLRDMLPKMSTAQQQQALTIINNSRSSYTYFKHKQRNSYNFWPKYPPVVFPNSPWERFSRSQALPDDIDDTSIILYALEVEDSIAISAKHLMQDHVNGGHNTIKNTFRKYRKYAAYSTWLGRKMPVDFDIAVHANVLFFEHSYRLPMNAVDSNTISLMEQMIIDREYMKHPGSISPHYGSSALILYHLARIMGRFSIPALSKHRPQLIADAYKVLKHAKDPMEKLILSTSLMKWGETLGPDNSINAETLLQQNDDFPFFRASFSSMLPGFLRKLLSGWPVINFKFFSPAFNDVLVLEYLLLKAESSKK